MTPAQLTSLKTDATVTRASTLYNGKTLQQRWDESDTAPLAFYNSLLLPVTKLWRPDVPMDRISGSLVVSEFLLLTIAKQNAWFALTQPALLDSTLTRTRQNFVDIFGAGSATMAALVLVSQRDATILEAFFSVSGGAPGTGNISACYGSILTAEDIAAARGM